MTGGTAGPDPGPRFRAAHAALRTAAVTGTNGKTTTVSLIDAIVRASGEPHARLTTLGAWVGDERIEAATPTDEFLACVERAVERGVRTLALETTSKSLGRGLARRWPAHVAVFTNLSRDHLDMHRSAEAYLAAKAQLFLALPAGGVAVLNADDPSSSLLAEVVPSHAAVRWYGASVSARDLMARRVHVHVGGTDVELGPSELAQRLGGQIRLRLHGAVHAHNALAAAVAADALGYDPMHVREGIEGFGGVPGRFEIVGHSPLVLVDYAHTPDGLRGTLVTARSLVEQGGRLVCVFGCGGDRDRGKRPEMGATAHALADRVVLTSDNPRREPPDQIAAEVRTGIDSEGAEWSEELDRRRAIEGAIAAAAPLDVVVIAGKGHEREQDQGDRKVPFDDAQVARAALARR